MTILTAGEEAPAPVPGASPKASATPPNDGAAPPVPTEKVAAPSAKEAAATPNYDPQLLGEVDPKTGRPVNVPSKYYDYDKREVKWHELLTQHNWLQKKLGDKREKPPEAYALTSDETFQAPDGLDQDPVYKGLATFAREELELSQGQWDQLIRRYWGLMSTSGQEITTAEIASLGHNGLSRLENMRAFLQANLSPESYQEAIQDVGRASTVAWLEEIMKAVLPPPLEHEGTAVNGQTDESLYQMQMAKDEYGQPKMANREYAANYRKRLAAHIAGKQARAKA